MKTRTIQNRTIGEVESERVEEQKKKEHKKAEIIDKYIARPANIFHSAFILGLGAGIFLFFASLGLRLGLGF